MKVSDSEFNFLLNNIDVNIGDTNDWSGPVRWFRGSLQVVHGSPEFPPGRELLFFHRPSSSINFPSALLENIQKDMMTYGNVCLCYLIHPRLSIFNAGYLLPNWIPLFSEHMCFPETNLYPSTTESLKQYRPYGHDCLKTWKDK